MGEVEIRDEPVAMADLSGLIEATPKATLFRAAGPERFEIVGAVSGSRRRLAAAFGVGEREVTREVMRRLGTPQQVVEVASADAPVHAVQITGADVDVTRLPFHLQHERDGAPYISAALDFTIDPATGKRNVGARRLMLRGRRELRTNLTDNSDLKQMYLACLERKQRLPISFVIGTHPVDFFTSGLKIPGDEFALLATLRGEAIPMVKSLTSDILVPADAELVIEGYLDEQGYREMDGPYGEFWGYYGAMHIDPVFHVTAITHRRDVLHQTVLHGPLKLARQEASHTTGVAAEMVATRMLRAADVEPAAIFSPPSAPIFHTMRVAIADATPEKVRAAIGALFGVKGIKSAIIVDDDIDVIRRRPGDLGDGDALRSRPGYPRVGAPQRGVLRRRQGRRGRQRVEGRLRRDRSDVALDTRQVRAPAPAGDPHQSEQCQRASGVGGGPEIFPRVAGGRRQP